MPETFGLAPSTEKAHHHAKESEDNPQSAASSISSPSLGANSNSNIDNKNRSSSDRVEEKRLALSSNQGSSDDEHKDGKAKL